MKNLRLTPRQHLLLIELLNQRIDDRLDYMNGMMSAWEEEALEEELDDCDNLLDELTSNGQHERSLKDLGYVKTGTVMVEDGRPTLTLLPGGKKS